MNQILLILIILLLLSAVFGIVYLIPIWFAKLRCRTFGIKLSFRQSKILAKKRCLHTEFLIGLREIWKIHSIDVEKLADHYLAGGNLDNVKHGILEFRKRKVEPNEWFLTTFDLAGRDLPEEILKAEKKNWKFEL